MDGISLGLALSLHLGLEGEYNSIHPHLRYTHDSFVAGAYYNSESNISPYAGYRIEYNDLGLELGLVGNYSHANIAPYVRGTYKQFFIAPGVEGDNIGIVFGFEIPITN